MNKETLQDLIRAEFERGQDLIYNLHMAAGTPIGLRLLEAKLDGLIRDDEAEAEAETA